jgi:hypothetical protein
MREILLIVWLLGYPLMNAVVDKLDFGSYVNKKKEFSENVRGIASIIHLIIWVGVAVFIWINF